MSDTVTPKIIKTRMRKIEFELQLTNCSLKVDSKDLLKIIEIFKKNIILKTTIKMIFNPTATYCTCTCYCILFTVCTFKFICSKYFFSYVFR